LDDFRNVLASSVDTRLMVVVDNTSTLAGLRRGVARSAALNEALLPAIEKLTAIRHMEVSARYIKSADNPADAPSRGVAISADEVLTLANRANLHVRSGGGEGDVITRTATRICK
jgi:hypothetical protein